MRRFLTRLLPVTIPLVLLQACAAGEPGGGGGATPPAGAPVQPGRYQATGTVLESPQHGPELCLGPVAESYPPQCRGIPITNWDWDKVEDKDSAAGATWGGYHVIGTYDGSSFTVTEVTAPRAASAPIGKPVEITSPCPEPDGGWPVPDPARASQTDLEAVGQAVRGQPDFAGMWISYLEPPGPPARDIPGDIPQDQGEFVLNLAFTGDLERHEAEAREHWGGRLCVTRHQRSLRDLQRIQEELTGQAAKDLGIQVLTAGADEYRNVVTLGVVAIDQRTMAAIEKRYGKGTVEVDAALKPVDGPAG